MRPKWIENEKANEPFIEHTIMELESKHKQPGIVVGAGYGFKDAVYEVYKRGKDILIIATDKAFPACWHMMDLDVECSPDYVVSLNTEETDLVKLKDWYAPAGEQNSLILPVTAHPSHVREWMNVRGGTIYWMVPANIDEDLATVWGEKYRVPPIPRGSNSGEFGFVMAFIMGCDPIGLVGMPYAWKTRQEVLDHGWSGYSQPPDNWEYHHFHQNGKDCFTTLGFMEQRTEFLEFVELTQHKRVYNLSEGGILYDNKLVKRSDVDSFLALCKELYG